MVRQGVLSNGVRVLSETMPDVVSATTGIWVENGSRYETPAQNGVSHFIEHLLFKGTRRRTAAQIAEEIDAVGGVLNAFTSKEYTCYYAKVLGEQLEMANELLADLFLNSVFDPGEIERERQVVLQEISQAEDTPDDFVHEIFNLRFWQGHPLALPIFGSVETVNAISREALLAFMNERYRAERVFIAAAGMVDHDRLVKQSERLFGEIAGNGRQEVLRPPAERAMVLHHGKPLEQVHLCIGAPGLGQSDPLRYAGYVLNAALGGGMSSRLFQEVRERRGRVYSIYSSTASFHDCGYLAIYAGTKLDWLDEVLEVTVKELADIARRGLKPQELERAKSQLKGNMLLGLESTESRMNRLARNEIYARRDISLSEVAGAIDQVANDQVVEIAASCFAPQRMGVVVLGDLKGKTIGAEVLSPLGR